jgi:hypothetical protein
MTSLSRCIRTAAVCAFLAGVWMSCLAPVVVGQEVPEDSVLVAPDSLPSIERARQFLIARQFEEALEAAESAADSLGLSPAGGYHEGYEYAGADTASVHLYRGLALELLRRFPEARADYDVLLSIEPQSWRADELRKRYPYVAGQSLRSMARTLRDDGVAPDTGIARFGVGGFPLYNASTILVMSQVSFGLTGVLNNGLALLDRFSDQSLPAMPYWQTRLLLDEILPEEVYGAGATVDIGGLARVLEVEFLTSGVLDEVSGSLTGSATVGAFSSADAIEIEGLQAGYTAVGLLDLQRTLVLSVADSIQARLNFEYVPSREAFADSLEGYLIDDVGRMLTYGFALEQLLLGELIEAEALMLDLPDQVAQLDLEQVEEIVAHSTPPEDNLLALTALSAAAIPVVLLPGPEADSLAADTLLGPPGPEDVDPEESARLLRSRTAHVVSSAAARNLGGYALWGPSTRTLRFDDLQREDPREGVPGTLDPTRIGPGDPEIPVEVVIPIPTVPKASPPGSQ